MVGENLIHSSGYFEKSLEERHDPDQLVQERETVYVKAKDLEDDNVICYNDKEFIVRSPLAVGAQKIDVPVQREPTKPPARLRYEAIASQLRQDRIANQLDQISGLEDVQSSLADHVLAGLSFKLDQGEELPPDSVTFVGERDSEALLSYMKLDRQRQLQARRGAYRRPKILNFLMNSMDEKTKRQWVGLFPPAEIDDSETILVEGKACSSDTSLRPKTSMELVLHEDPGRVIKFPKLFAKSQIIGPGGLRFDDPSTDDQYTMQHGPPKVCMRTSSNTYEHRRTLVDVDSVYAYMPC